MNHQSPGRFLILDGNSLLHRAWHAVPPLSTKSGLVVNAVYGFANIVEKLFVDYAPTHMAVAWDLPGGTFRHEAFEAYKAQREEKEQELYDQIPMIQELMAAYGVTSVSVEGFEADDVIGTLSKMGGDMEVVVLTGDLDALQLVRDQVRVDVFVKGLSQVKTYDRAAVVERYGLVPEDLILYKALVGDSSDNLPGVKGVGPKTAVELVRQFHTADGLIAAMKEGKIAPSPAKKLAGQEETLKLMERLVTVVCDVPVPTLEVLKVREKDLSVLLPLLRKYEFGRLLRKYEEQTVKEVKEVATSELTTAKGWQEVPGKTLTVMAEFQAADLFGQQIAWVALLGDGVWYFKQQPGADDIAALVARLNTTTRWQTFDAKRLFHAIGEAIEVPVDDVMVMAYVRRSGERAITLEAVGTELGIHVPQTPEVRVLAVRTLAEALRVHLVEEKVLPVYEEIEAPLIPVLYRMEVAGIAVDRARLNQLQEEFGTTIARLQGEITKLAGKEFNINSPAQLSEVLFTHLGLPTKGIKKTTQGFSTAAPELEKIADAHPILEKIGEYREVSKLKSTYADTLPTLVAPDGRIHTTFQQCIAATGRLSSANPNVQNIPIRSELGRALRSTFVSSPGKLLLSLDYSQIELRLVAAIANDASFLDAFRSGEDIHKKTAAEIWQVELGDVTKEQRAAAKAINFSILYGVGARSLARSTGLRFEEAREFLDRYFSLHPAIAEYLDAQKAQAHSEGYVETLFGRRRYVPEIHSGVAQLVAAAERMAINMPIQGTNADIIKKAMIELDALITKEQLPASLLLQVHDELVFEVDTKAADELAKRFADVMEGVVTLAVPLTVDSALAERWGDME